MNMSMIVLNLTWCIADLLIAYIYSIDETEKRFFKNNALSSLASLIFLLVSLNILLRKTEWAWRNVNIVSCILITIMLISIVESLKIT